MHMRIYICICVQETDRCVLELADANMNFTLTVVQFLNPDFLESICDVYALFCFTSST